MRSIGVVTTSRADYGILRPVLRAIAAHDRLDLRVFVAGTHLGEAYGSTVRDIEADGFPIAARLDTLPASDTPEGVAGAMGAATASFGGAFAAERPDIVVVVGDRYEMHAAALAALPFPIPLAHLHGGEVTEGAIDDALRHAITKMSHLHLPATADSARRIAQLGEEPWRIRTVGAPALDDLRAIEILPREQLGVAPGRPFVLLTYHPVTLQPEHADAHLDALLAAVADVDADIVVTHPNADPGRSRVLARLESFAAGRPGTQVVVNAGTQRYFSLMAHAAAMIGNSSSGIIEAASFELPVVNVGIRQRGRLHAENVLEAADHEPAIRSALAEALSPGFRASLRGMENPYGDGRAAERIARHLAEVDVDERLLVKRFQDMRR